MPYKDKAKRNEYMRKHRAWERELIQIGKAYFDKWQPPKLKERKK